MKLELGPACLRPALKIETTGALSYFRIRAILYRQIVQGCKLN